MSNTNEGGCSRCDLQPDSLGDICTCGKRLRTIPNSNGEQFYIGQFVAFLSKTQVTTTGYIRSIPKDRPDHAVVRYAESSWANDRFNEEHPVSRIAQSMVVLAENLPKRSRGQVVVRYEPQPAPKASSRAKKQVTSSSRKAVAKKHHTGSSSRKTKTETKATHVSDPTPKDVTMRSVTTPSTTCSSVNDAPKLIAPPRRAVPAKRIPDGPLPELSSGDLWIIDIILQQPWEPGSEHDTCQFNPSLRTGNMSICKFERVEDLICRVRLVECCAVKKHRGISRLDRCQQRALLHRIYESATASDPGPSCFPRRAFTSSADVPKGAQHQLR